MYSTVSNHLYIAYYIQGINKKIIFHYITKQRCIKDAVAQKFEDFKLGQKKFGPSWSTHWFHIKITILKELDGQQVVLQWDMGCEGMVWNTDGLPLQGLTGGCK